MARVSIAIVLLIYLFMIVMGVLILHAEKEFSLSRYASCNTNTSVNSGLVRTAYLIIFMSAVGMCKISCSVKMLRGIYVMGIILVTLVIFLMEIYGILVMNRGSDKVDNPMVEQRLKNFSPTLVRYVTKKWPDIKTCLVWTDTCTDVDAANPRSDGSINTCKNKPKTPTLPHRVHQNTRLLIKRSCCIPPRGCEYAHHNHSSTPFPSPASTSPSPSFEYDGKDDCSKWSNNWSELCFNCDSCMAGFAAEMVLSWKRNFFMESTYLLCIIVILSISLRATYPHDEEEVDVEVDDDVDVDDEEENDQCNADMLPNIILSKD